MEAFVLMSTAEKPSRSVSTTKPRMSPDSSSFAHTMATCAREPEVIQRFTPVMT